MTEYLDVSYSVWAQLVQNQSWPTYHYDDSGSYDVWTGNRDRVYASRVNEENLVDWQSDFESASMLVSSSEDAIALIVGLSGIKVRPLSADGTPVVSKHQLVLGRESFKRVDDSSENMAVDGLAAGSSLSVWNGTGDAGADWTATGTGSQSGAAAQAGTQGWDSGLVALGGSTLFDNGSALTIAGTYDVLRFHLQPRVWGLGGSLTMHWRDASNAQVGNAVIIPAYTSNMDTNVWKDVSIPIADFGLTGDVRYLRIDYSSVAQRHWFDNFSLQASAGGGPYLFRVSAPTGLIYHVEKAVLVIAAPDSGWSSTAFATIAGGLSNGLLLRHYNTTTAEVYGTFNSRTNVELFGQYNAEVSTFSDNTLIAAFSIDPDLSSVVLVDDDDVLEFVVRDDLSSLGAMRAYIHYGKESL